MNEYPRGIGKKRQQAKRGRAGEKWVELGVGVLWM